mmetsp:Transcript_50597/g.90390  ORF Transcript_50597/g.90390 Transcript_50597/m.90390 type:complete len:245 (+) Transcript_50597:2265-2999(+)
MVRRVLPGLPAKGIELLRREGTRRPAVEEPGIDHEVVDVVGVHDHHRLALLWAPWAGNGLGGGGLVDGADDVLSTHGAQLPALMGHVHVAAAGRLEVVLEAAVSDWRLQLPADPVPPRHVHRGGPVAVRRGHALLGLCHVVAELIHSPCEGMGQLMDEAPDEAVSVRALVPVVGAASGAHHARLVVPNLDVGSSASGAARGVGPVDQGDQRRPGQVGRRVGSQLVHQDRVTVQQLWVGGSMHTA